MYLNPYLQTYFKHSSSHQRGGGSYPSDPQFFNKFQGTVLDINNPTEIPIHEIYNILFNLYLVYRGARLAFLFESSNLSSLNVANQVRTVIKTNFPVFQETLDPTNPTVQRYFYHINPLPVKQSTQDDDDWVGQILEFSCPGDLNVDTDKVRKTINYQLILPTEIGYSFWTEICAPKENLNALEQEIKIREEKFNQIAQELGFKVMAVVTDTIPDSYYFDRLLKKDWNFFEQHQEDFLEYPVYNTYPSFADHIREMGVMNFIKEYYPYALFITFIYMDDPLGKYIYPITSDQSNQFDEIQKVYIRQLMNSKNADPFTDFLIPLIKHPFVQQLAQEKGEDLTELQSQINQLHQQFQTYI